ncbi:hypothetical protein OROGR_010168 [Orobanche gracilis]
MEDDRVEKSEKSVASINDLLGAEYQTREELLKVVKGFYSIKGYALSIKGSGLNKYVTLGCTGVFKATMGLPCAHMMSSWMGKAIPVTAIHQQWRIDSRDAIFATGDDDPFNGLLERLAVKYPQLPILEKKHIQEKLCELVGEDFSLSFEPNVLRGRGRPPIGKKRKAINSTVRDPSQFEVVEHILKQRGQRDGETMSHIDLNETPDLVDLEITSWSEFFAVHGVDSH